MYKKKSRKSKKSRQNWWRNLSDEKKSIYIDKIMLAKAEKRANRSIMIMEQHGDKYKCSDCIHSGSCTDNLPNSCEFWYNAKTHKGFEDGNQY